MAVDTLAMLSQGLLVTPQADGSATLTDLVIEFEHITVEEGVPDDED